MRHKRGRWDIVSVVLPLLVGVGILVWVVATTGAGTSLKTLFRLTKNLATIGSRQVDGPVIALTGDGDDQVADLFIENWNMGKLFPNPNTSRVIPIFWSVTHVKSGQRTIRWETDVGADESSPEVNAAFDGTMIYLSVNDRLQALRQAEGELLWEAALSDLVDSRCWRCIEVVNGRVVVLSVDQVLQALDVNTGETIWQVRLNDDSAPGSVGFAVVGQQVLVIDGTEDASYDKELRFYNAMDGTLIRKLAPPCSDPDRDLSDWELDRWSPVLVDESNSKIYSVIDPVIAGPGSSPCVQSWDISSGDPVWQVQLPEDTKLARDIRGGLYINPSGPFFVLGEGALYVPVATALSDSAIVRIDLHSGQSHTLLVAKDFATMPLGEQDSMLIVRAKRTRGSDRTELWGLDRDSGERLWRHELQVAPLLNVDHGLGQKWAYRFTSRGLTVLQLIAGPDRLQVQMIDVPTGRVVYETSSRLDNDYWTAVTWTQNTAYLSIRNLYTVDLETGEAAWEWP